MATNPIFKIRMESDNNGGIVYVSEHNNAEVAHIRPDYTPEGESRKYCGSFNVSGWCNNNTLMEAMEYISGLITEHFEKYGIRVKIC